MALILTSHLWPQKGAHIASTGTGLDVIYEPSWRSIGEPFDAVAFEVFGLIAFGLHGYSQSRNKPLLALAFGLVSGIGAFVLIGWAYYRALGPALERLIIDMSDTGYWAAVATADGFLGGEAGIQGAGVVCAVALLLASLASRFVARFLSKIVARTGA